MKEEKLFEIVNNVDDELICEMLDYGADTEKKGEEYEGKLYSGPEKPRKIHYWRYPVTAAAVMLVLVGVLFIFNANNTLPYNEEEITGSGEGAADVSDDTATEQQPTVELARPPREVKEYSLDYEPLEETPDVALATNFVNDFFYAKDIGDPVLWYDYLDVDKYFDNPYLKRYVEYHIDNWTRQYSGDIIFYEPDYVVAFYSKQAGDINYISVATERFWMYESLYPDWSGTGETAVVGIRDGKVVNFSIYGLGGHWIANLWDEDFDSEDWLSYDFTDHENPWDNEEYAKKILDGLGISMSENTDAVTSHALDILHCRLSEDGHYRVDDDAVTESDDYDLYRKYFFGAWDGTFSYHFLADAQGMIIDDSLNSFNMQSPEPWYTGNFYRIGDSTLSFITGSMGGGTVFWLDMNDPETMYSAGGGFGEHNWIWTEEEDEMPVVSVLKKTAALPNEPEDNFMSIFKLREISRDYGIDIELLTDLGFEYYGEDGGRYWLSHDYTMSFYPVYLVSQSPDKFEFTATVTGGYDDVEAEAYYTIEKINGEWVRTEEGYRNVKDNVVGSRALTLLRCWKHEDGLYRVDQDVVTAIDDYDLFRKYFFGTWEGKSESERMVIDDSLKSFNMTNDNVWYSGSFYRIGDNTYAFVQGSTYRPMVYWLNTLDPDTMYAAYGEVENWLLSTNEDKTAPVVYSLKKTSAPPNKPEENFLSIFKLYDMSQDYGIDFDLLVDIMFDYKEGGSEYLLQHNDITMFYPVYLVSESADKLELKTTIGYKGYFGNHLEFDASCIFEKSNGKWTRTVSVSGLDQEVTLIGDYDRSSLADFDYSGVLAKIDKIKTDDTGGFLDNGYSEFKELYRKAYALNTIMVLPDLFPNTADIGSPTFKWDDLPRIQVTDESYPAGCYTYYLTGYNFVDFYNKMTEVFTKEQADELIFVEGRFYNYEGALWCSYGAAGGDGSRVHTEYAVEKTDDILDIIRTTYHVPLGAATEFDPEKIDEYETKETHFTFIRFKDGSWRASEFADVR